MERTKQPRWLSLKEELHVAPGWARFYPLTVVDNETGKRTVCPNAYAAYRKSAGLIRAGCENLETRRATRQEIAGAEYTLDGIAMRGNLCPN